MHQSVVEMKSSREVSFYFVIYFHFVKASPADVLVTDEGKIDGSVLLNRWGEPFHAFRKIPYAEPPMGALRFKTPLPKKPWQGVLDCTHYGPMCMQHDFWGGRIPISEDCLHLNVFTKNRPNCEYDFKELKPVIAFLHGGGFEAGSAIDYGPEYLMERDIVLVTIQFRLGAFGFLALDTPDVPGNAGFKDQHLALRWIKRNIKHFGGDPNKVTLAGLSSGAHSATAHMISPMFQGLFHNVIAASGALPWQRKLKTNNIELSRQLAGRVSCHTENIDAMIQCLTFRSAEEIAQNMIFPLYHCPVMTWGPVIEPFHGQERFLVDEPNKLFSEGKFARVNVMVGITADEFVLPIAGILGNSNLTYLVNHHFEDIAPECFSFELDDVESTRKMTRELSKFYVPFDTLDVRAFDGLSKFMADGTIGYGVHKFVHHVSKLNNAYYYKFSFIGRYSQFLYPRNHPYGVHHSDDIQYVFVASFIGASPIKFLDPENVAVERMTRIWEQFAKTGNPNNYTDKILQDMHWPKHDAAKEFYLDMGTHLTEKNGLFLDRYKVWEDWDKSSATKASLSLFSLIFSLLLVL